VARGAAEHGKAQDVLRSLVAAAARDITGESTEAIAEFFGYADKRSVRRAVAAGRTRWVRLGAWPWTYFAYLARDECGQPLKDWRSNAFMLAALEAWESDQPPRRETASDLIAAIEEMKP